MKNTFKLIPLCAALVLTGVASTSYAQATPAALLQRLEAMDAEIKALRSELAQVKSAQTQTEATAQQASSTAAKAQTEAQTAVAAVATGVGGTGMKLGGPSTVLTGYGELVYTRPTKNTKAAEADLRRAVIGLQHRFNDKTKLVTEIEFEHAVTSATDRGEVAIEQAYVEHQLNNKLAARAGLFLIPMGLVNENHDPYAFYGVDRPLVETAIIPSTWREGGLMLVGTQDNGVSWKAGISTGFDLTKWDSKGGDGKESPLGSTHQELQFAKSKNLSVFGSVDWRGTPGLLVGGGLFMGKAGHGSLVNGLGAAVNANPRVTIWDLHARWTPGKWDLSAVYAAGSISDTATLNVPFAGDPTPIPSKFDGMYVQAAYNVWSQGDYQVKPFVRYERVNTAKAYAGFPTGLGRAADPYEKVLTLGANFHLAPTVVVKADYQTFSPDKNKNRLNLGLGYSF